MTNKKAIEWLKLELEKGVSWDDTSESTKNIREQAEVEIKEAFDMAIKALEQEPCDDCISREAMLALQAKYAQDMRSVKFWQMRDNIKALPSVTPKEKTGKWIDTDEWRETVDGFEQWGYFRKCSKCGYVFKFLEIDNYCPNCGARMEVEND